MDYNLLYGQFSNEFWSHFQSSELAQGRKSVTFQQWLKRSKVARMAMSNYLSASCDHGLISYLTDEDVEMAGDPVLVVRNIDNMSVTITCNKNLSCYGVRVYFQENPDPLDNETIEPETGVEHTHTDLKATKILRDGQLLIIRDGKTCNIVGTIVR